MRTIIKWGLMVVLATASRPAVQAACTYSLSTATRNHGYGAATNSLTVNAGVGCPWAIDNTNSWLTILNPGPGTGTGVVTYAVAANPITTGRTGVVAVAGLTFTVMQDPAPCNFGLSPSQRTHGHGGVMPSTPVAVSAASNCAWSVVVTNPWVTVVPPGSGSGGGSFQYNLAPNNAPVQRTSYVAVADQTFTLAQLAAPCFYELSPTNRTHGYAGSTGLVNLAASPGCAWFVANTNSWISIITAGSGTNSGSFVYQVAPNPDSTPRNGTFTVWNEVFGVYQQPAPCNVTLQPSSVSPSAEAGTNVLNILIPGGCAWAVTNTNSWISFTGPTNGVGDGSLTWIVSANAGPLGRTGVVSILDKTFTVKQDPAVCNYKLSPTNRVHGYGAASNFVNLTVLSTCAWTVQNSNTWVTITTPLNGIGSAAVGYTVTANGGASSRSGTVVIGGQPFNLVQNGLSCALNLSPMSRNHGHGLATNTIIVDTAAGCDWNAVNTNAWLDLSLTNGTGSNTIVYTVAPNPSSIGRTAYITINEAQVLITQNPAPCDPTLVPGNFNFGPAQQTGTVSVLAPIACDWNVINTNNWVTLLSPANGTGSNTVTYFVTTNLNPLARSGTLTIGGKLHTILQDGVTCSYRVAPTNRTHGFGANTNFLTIIVSDPCPWTVVNTNNWITLLTSPTGTGSNIVTYAIAANNTPDTRQGIIDINGAQSMITQNGTVCGYSLTPAQRSHGYSPATNSFTVVTTATGCPWTVSNSNTWVVLTGVTNGTNTDVVGYTVAENTNLAERIAWLTVDTQTFVITQSAASCGFNLSPSARTHGFGATTNTVSITAGAACSWSVTTTNTWINFLTPTTGQGNSNVTYTIAANFESAPRTGRITMMDKELLITQLAPTNGFVFEVVSVSLAGDLTVRLGGGPAGIWELQSSSNLVNWVKVADLTNTTGRVQYHAPPPLSTMKYLRAILP